MSKKNTKTTWLNWFGFTHTPDFRKARWLSGFFGVGLSIFAFALVLAAAITLFKFLSALMHVAPYSGDTDDSAIRNIGLVLAALIGAPFIIWRSAVAAKQASIQDESLFNDKINAASRDLAARRTVTRRVREVRYELNDTKQTAQEIRGEPVSLPVDAQNTTCGPWTFVNEEEDDLVTRAVAIDRLEGLANEHPNEASRIASMLSVYIRELSREFPAKEDLRKSKKSPLESNDGSAEIPAKGPRHHRAHIREAIEHYKLNSIKYWASKLKPIRTDMERAAQTLGRLKSIEGEDTQCILIDLHGANLQGFDLNGCVFNDALLKEARMEGANLSATQLDGADLRGARMEGANLSKARMRKANLNGAKIIEADLSEARMAGANLSEAWIEGADFSEARMEGADLSKARMEGANLCGARMEEATLHGTQMAGAILDGARMAGVIFSGVNLFSATKFHPGMLRGAGCRFTHLGMPPHALPVFDEFPITPQVEAVFNETFGDASIVFPEGFSRPDHWSDKILDWDEFETQWRAFQRSIGYTPSSQF